jgi:hypothetical protein
MESFITILLGIFGALIGTFKVVRSLRRDDSTRQEVGLWVLFLVMSLIVIGFGVHYGFIQVG